MARTITVTIEKSDGNEEVVVTVDDDVAEDSTDDIVEYYRRRLPLTVVDSHSPSRRWDSERERGKQDDIRTDVVLTSCFFSVYQPSACRIRSIDACLC